MPSSSRNGGWAESRFLHTVHVNADGSRDWGPLQVNETWTPAVVGQTTKETIRLGVSAYLDFQSACRAVLISNATDATGQDLAACTAHAYRTGEVLP